MSKENEIFTNNGFDGGLTLIEILIAIMISSTLVLGAFTVFSYTNRSSISQTETSSIHKELLMVMDIIERDIKNTGSDPKGDGNFTVFYHYMPGESYVSGGFDYQNNICVQFDLSQPPDGDVNNPGEQVLYYNNSKNQLLRLESISDGNWPKVSDVPTGYLLATSMGMNVEYTTGGIAGQKLNRVNTVTLTLTKKGSRNDPDTGSPSIGSLKRTIGVRNYGTR